MDRVAEFIPRAVATDLFTGHSGRVLGAWATRRLCRPRSAHLDTSRAPSPIFLYTSLRVTVSQGGYLAHESVIVRGKFALIVQEAHDHVAGME